jgi:methyl-accepting chemotaxis protein
MDSMISISLGQLMVFLLYSIGMIAGIFLILVLVKAFSVLKRLNTILTDNQENVNQLLDVLPKTVDSINEGVEGIKRTVDAAADTMEYIGDNVTVGRSSSFGSAEGILEIVRVASEVAKAVIHYFSKGD